MKMMKAELLKEGQKIPEDVKKSIQHQIFLKGTYGEDIAGLTEMLSFSFQMAVDKNYNEEDFLDLMQNAVTSIFQKGYEEAENNQKKFMDCDFKSEDEEMQVLDNIQEYAGAFVKEMGHAYRHADPINKRKLRYTFWNYFKEYLPK